MGFDFFFFVLRRVVEKEFPSFAQANISDYDDQFEL
jgi:hypothetical protein